MRLPVALGLLLRLSPAKGSLMPSGNLKCCHSPWFRYVADPVVLGGPVRGDALRILAQSEIIQSEISTPASASRPVLVFLSCLLEMTEVISLLSIQPRLKTSLYCLLRHE